MESHTALSLSRSRPAGILLILALVASLIIPLAQPAEAGPTFTDDDGNPHESAIEYMAARGVTKGCNPPANDRYCPDRPVTRGEMAAFLQRAFDLDSGSKNRFRDDDRSPFQSAINAVGKAGVTKGCNPPTNDRYCPDARVTRGEMAAFINRVLELDKGGDFFSDDDGSVFEADINAIARVGISKGCNPPANDRFCADRNVTRGEMATFLTRTMEIRRTGTTTTTTPSPRDGSGGTGETPPDRLPDACDTDVPRGPSSPTGDVVIRPGQNIQSVVDNHPAGTRFVIASGVHKNQQVRPRNGDEFVGQPGAVLDGGGSTEYAFGGPGDSVLIEGLEITNYNSPVGKGVLRSVHGASNWTIRANEIHHNMGQGINMVVGFKVIGNYIHHNQQYGLGGQGPGLVVEGNRISHNNRYGERQNPYSGAGGMKVANTKGMIIRDNCSHDNDGPGLWTDGDNIDVLYENNTVVDNAHAGIKHEVSCRATIRGNTALGNGFGVPHWVEGGGIVVLNSSNVTITGNIVRGNHDGIGAIYVPRSQSRGDNCEWRLTNLRVEGNTVSMSEGETGIAVSNAGSEVYSSWNNRFTNNNYELSPSNGEFFRWTGNKHLTLQEWKSAGQG